MTALGSDFAMLLLVSGNWHSIAQHRDRARASSRRPPASRSRCAARPSARSREDMVPYSVDVVCLDQAGHRHGAFRLLLVARHRHRRALDAQLRGGAHRRADVLRLHGRQRAGTDPRRRAARGVHGLLRPDEPRRDPRAGQELTRHGREAAMTDQRRPKAPDFALPTTGGEFRLRRAAAAGTSSSTSIRATTRPGCTLEGSDFRDLASRVPPGAHDDPRRLDRHARIARQVQGQR